MLDSPEENMRVGKSDGIGCVRYPDGHWSFNVMAEKWKENWSHRKIKAYMMITRRVVAMHFFFEIFYCIDIIFLFWMHPACEYCEGKAGANEF